ncbi:MAG: oligosaccharide flippase family protein, partial [Gammaproteobacteria bacterium]
MSELARFFKHSSIYAVGNIINRIGAFILLPIYTNYLTVGEYGTLELFYVVMSVISGILAVGLAHATLRFYFDYDSQEERNLTITTNYIGSFVITLGSVAFLAMFSGQISGLVFEDKSLEIGIYLILTTIVFELSSQICLAYVRAI